MMQRIKGMFLFLGVISLNYASGSKALPQLKSNMTLEYPAPKSVESLQEIFTEGVFYGRLRSNYFWSNKGEEHYVYGLGGSFIFKSACMNGFGFTTGMYTTQNPWHMKDEDAVLYKAGKDVLSRYDVLSRGAYGITSLAQAYLEYHTPLFSLKAGRLLFESFLTKSNDTKMIPNAFEGITLYTEMFPHTKIKSAFFTRQKLRDHSSFHHLFAFAEDSRDPYVSYTQNDDGAMHEGITLSKLRDAGIKDRLIVCEIKNRTVEHLLLTLNYTALPELLSSAMIEAKYRFFTQEFNISPAVRVMRQFDHGAGKIGGANLKTNTFGYDDPNSLEGTLFAARIDVAEDAWKVRLGYSKVADQGDIVAPWRGLPTAGFTRAMGQTNWYANTTSYMLRADYDLDRAGIFRGTKIFTRYVKEDFDDNKPGVQADSSIWTLDIIKTFKDMPGFSLKTRMAHVWGDKETIAGDGTLKSDPSYNEFRFEINYLF